MSNIFVDRFLCAYWITISIISRVFCWNLFQLTLIPENLTLHYFELYDTVFVVKSAAISGVPKFFFRDLRAHKSETTHWNIFKLSTFGTYNDFREHVKFRYSNPSSFKENVQDVTQVRFGSYHKSLITLYLPSWVWSPTKSIPVEILMFTFLHIIVDTPYFHFIHF